MPAVPGRRLDRAGSAFAIVTSEQSADDPCHHVVPDDRYVALAHGRDYLDVRPISGIYYGAATSKLTVSVEVTRLA